MDRPNQAADLDVVSKNSKGDDEERLQEVITGISCPFNLHLNAIKIKFFEHLLPIP